MSTGASSLHLVSGPVVHLGDSFGRRRVAWLVRRVSRPMLKPLPHICSPLPNIVYMKSTNKTHRDLDELEKGFQFIEAKVYAMSEECDNGIV